MLQSVTAMSQAEIMDWLFMVGPWVIAAVFIVWLFYFKDRGKTR